MQTSTILSNETRHGHCDAHGEYESKCLFSQIWTKCPVCANEDSARRAAEVAEQERVAEENAWLRRLGSSGIPLRFQNRTLKNFMAETELQQRALDFAIQYAAEFERGHSGRCALFLGEPGTGKTHLACGIALRAMRCHKIPALFTTISKMALRVREAKNFESRNETESEAISLFTYPKLLIVDEVGVQSGTDAEARILFDVINDRYENIKPTIFLSNLDKAGVQAALGDRIFDRIREGGGELIVFDGGSYRGKVAA